MAKINRYRVYANDRRFLQKNELQEELTRDTLLSVPEGKSVSDELAKRFPEYNGYLKVEFVHTAIYNEETGYSEILAA